MAIGAMMEENVVKSKWVRREMIERAKLKLEIQVNVQEENVVEVQVAHEKEVTEA
jgi:hypothetical protein